MINIVQVSVDAQVTNMSSSRKPSTCSVCGLQGHTKTSNICKKNADKTDAIKSLIVAKLMESNCLENSDTELLQKLVEMTGHDFSDLEKVYKTIDPFMQLDRPCGISSYIAALKETSTNCFECNAIIYTIQKNTNPIWSGKTLCSSCWCNHKPDRDALWDKINENVSIVCKICCTPKIHCDEKYHFDHKNMFDKSDSVFSMVHSGCSIESILEEITKCQILCFRCHHIVTDIERRLDFTRIKSQITKQSNSGKITDAECDEQMDICQKKYESIMTIIYEQLEKLFD